MTIRVATLLAALLLSFSFEAAAQAPAKQRVVFQVSDADAAKWNLALLTGVYQHVSEQHLQRYVTEFDFRCNNRAVLGVSDEQRAAQLVRGGGKRLTYKLPHQAPGT